jgi:hypothetical protein
VDPREIDFDGFGLASIVEMLKQLKLTTFKVIVTR